MDAFLPASHDISWSEGLYMSSPTVIIGTPAPRLIARAANRDAMDSYMARAKQVYEDMMQLRVEIAASGGRPVKFDVVPFSEAESQANALFESSDTFSAVTYSHAYWRSLKHPWYDQMLRRFGEVAAEKQEVRARDAANLNRMAGEILSQIKTSATANQFTQGKQSGGPTFRWDTALDASVKAILEHTPEDQRQSVSETILRIAPKPPQERFLAFENLRLSVEQKSKERFEEEALSSYRLKQAQLARQAMTVQIARCEAIAEQVDSPETDRLHNDLQDMREKLASDNVVVLEDRLTAIELSLIKEKSEQALLQATVQALKRQGYQQVEVMGTLRPQDIDAVYMLDPNDDNRLTLLRSDEEGGRIAAMVVAREDVQSSQSERRRDLAAQHRLCKAMDVAERVLAQRWQCEVSRTPPGEKIKVDRRLQDCKVKSARRGAAQKQRSTSL
jgi:hypothetical protein